MHAGTNGAAAAAAAAGSAAAAASGASAAAAAAGAGSAAAAAAAAGNAVCPPCHFAHNLYAATTNKDTERAAPPYYDMTCVSPLIELLTFARPHASWSASTPH